MNVRQAGSPTAVAQSRLDSLMPLLIGLIALLAGTLNTVQSGANVTLNKTLGQPILAALIVAGTNVCIYLAAGTVLGLAWPGTAKFAQVPWWAWLGGAIFTGLTVTAAIVTSVLLDHFGWVGFAQHTAGLWRIVGCILMIAGLALVSAF